jgi:serine/threonine-protein kinase
VGAIAAVIATLAIGLLIALSQSRRAQQAAHSAVREAQKAKAVQSFLLKIFQSNTDAQADPVKARATTARELLDIGASRVGKDLNAQPEVQEAVLETLVDMYAALGLDRQAGAFQLQRIEALKRAYGATDPRVADELLSYSETVGGSFADSKRALALLAEPKAILDANHDMSSAVRGRLLMDAARYQLVLAPAKAAQTADSAVELFRRNDPENENLSIAMSYAGRARYWLGDYGGAEAAYREALVEVHKHEPNMLQSFVTDSLGLADVEFALGRVAVAESLLRDALARSQALNGTDHVDTLHVETRLGLLLHATSRRAEGRQLLADTASKVRSGNGLDVHNLTGPVYRNLGVGLVADGRWEDAGRPLSMNLEQKRKQGSSAYLAIALDDQATLYALLGRYDAAQTEFAQAYDIWRGAVGDAADPATSNRFLLHQGDLLLATGHPADAQERFKQVAIPHDVRLMLLDVDAVLAKVGLAGAYLALGRVDDGYRVAQAATAELQHSAVRDYYQSLEADALLRLGESQMRLHDSTAANVSLERALQLRTANGDANSPWIAEIDIALASCALDLGDPARARKFAARAQAIHGAHAELGEQFKRPLRELVVAMRGQAGNNAAHGLPSL